MATSDQIECLAADLRESAEQQRKPVPRDVTPRMCCYVRAYFADFPGGFSLGDAMDRGYLPAGLMSTYKVDSGVYADRSILSTQLSDCGLLEIENGHRSFQLTDRGRVLAQVLCNNATISGAEAL